MVGGVIESLSLAQTVGGGLLVSPSMAQTVGGGLLVSPSLAQTVGLADCTGLPNPHSCHYCGTNPRFDFLLVSLTWFKPGERLSLANRWMCQYPYGKNTGVSRGKNRGESNVIHVSQPLLVSLSMAQTRVATPV